MRNISLPATYYRCVRQSVASISILTSKSLMGLFVLLFVAPMAWSQSYPAPIYATSGFHYSTPIAANSSPGVAPFNGGAELVWCGTNGTTNVVQSAFQYYPGYAGTVNTSTIPCTGGSAKGRITVAYFPGTGKLYAVGGPLNTTPGQVTIIFSSDGILWQSTPANITYFGNTDSALSHGFGLYAFSDGKLYLAYASQSSPGSPSPSVASSADGVNFEWKANVSSIPLWNETAGWLQSPAVFYWPVQGGSGTGNLYVSYLSTGGYAVMARSADGVNWSSALIPGGLHLNRDAMLFAHDSALWYGGQSYYSPNNIWLAGSFDGVNFAPGYNQGGVTTTSPSSIDFNGYWLLAFRGSNGDPYVSYTNQ